MSGAVGFVVIYNRVESLYIFVIFIYLIRKRNLRGGYNCAQLKFLSDCATCELDLIFPSIRDTEVTITNFL